MKLSDLYVEIARRESKRSQCTIGNIREVIATLSDILIESPEVGEALTANGLHRAKSKKRPK